MYLRLRLMLVYCWVEQWMSIKILYMSLLLVWSYCTKRKVKYLQRGENKDQVIMFADNFWYWRCELLLSLSHWIPTSTSELLDRCHRIMYSLVFFFPYLFVFAEPPTILLETRNHEQILSSSENISHLLIVILMTMHTSHRLHHDLWVSLPFVLEKGQQVTLMHSALHACMIDLHLLFLHSMRHYLACISYSICSSFQYSHSRTKLKWYELR